MRIDEVEAEIDALDALDALVEELLLASRFDLGSVAARCGSRRGRIAGTTGC